MGHFRVLVALSIVSERGPICYSRPRALASPSASESENNNKKKTKKNRRLNEFFSGLLHRITLFRRSLLLPLVVVPDNKGADKHFRSVLCHLLQSTMKSFCEAITG